MVSENSTSCKMIGYASVPTADISIEPQRAALQAAGFLEILEDVVPASMAGRPGFTAMRERAGPGVVIGVWRLDRLASSYVDLVEIVTGILDAGAEFVSLTDGIDTRRSSAAVDGYPRAAIVSVFVALRAFAAHARSERALRQAVRHRRGPGAPSKLDRAARAEADRRLLDGESPGAVAAAFGLNRSTMVRRRKVLRAARTSPNEGLSPHSTPPERAGR